MYRQLADLLRATVATLPAGARLPSELAIRQTHGVGRDTVRSALRLLRDEGLVEVRSGYGWLVRGPVERIRVRVPRGATAYGRPATPEEQTDHGIDPGGYVQVVEIGGRTVSVTALDRTLLTFA
nr:winged helix-turn-helix domain-containing protein [Micromonospora pisi]